MVKYLRVYKSFINAGLQEAVVYRTNWIFWVLGNVLGCFISYFLWKAVFLSSESESFMGFSMEQMVIYIFITFMTANFIGSGGSYDLGQEIKDGSIAMRIIKPISFNSTYLFQELGYKIMGMVVLFIPLIIGVEAYRFYVTGSFQFDIAKFLIYVISIFCAYLINFFFNICFGFTAFVFKNLWGANVLKNSIIGFLSGAVIPLAFLPEGIRDVLMIFPFASLSYTPVMIYMGMYSGSTMLFYLSLQIFWCIFFWGLSKMIWRLVIKHLSVQGG